MQKLIVSIFAALIGFFPCMAQVSSNNLDVTLKETTTYRQVEEKEVQRLIELIEENICNPSWLESEAWQSLVSDIQSEEMLKLPLNEFQSQFNQKVKTLPFTHLYLKVKKAKSSKSKTTTKKSKPAFELEALNDETALLTVRAFISDASEMVRIVQEVQTDGYKNLVIDLRENTGGTLDAAVVLGRFLTNEPIDAGVYLTRKWFLNNDDYPTKEQIQGFPFLKDMTYAGITRAYADNDAFRMVLPPHTNPTFQGKVAVLTSNITGSACEPLVDLLKKKEIATIVGRKTAGGMLSGYDFTINDDLTVFLPIADFMTDQGYRIDKVGVEPNISVRAEKALEYVMEHLF